MKPIHKLNGGLGATLCHKCSVIITNGLTDDLYCNKCRKELLQDIMKGDEELGLYEEPKYKLVRERDGLIKQSQDVKWLEFDDEGKYKEDFKDVAVGRSLIMSPFNKFFTWQTTPVIEIIEQKENYLKFNTKNSVYELFKI
jgi:hypothetical protein